MSRYYRSFLEESGVAYTARTTAFATATAITDTTILNALNTFDLGLISNGLDTKMKALYPFVGGTASTHKYNFMDARDLDVAFRLQFNGGWTHSANGILGNATNSYSKTFFNTLNYQNSNHISLYIATNKDELAIDMGVIAGSNGIDIESRVSNNAYFFNFNSAYSTVSNIDSRGFFVNNRTSSILSKVFKSNSLIATNTVTSANFGGDISIGARYDAGNGIYQYFASKQYGFSSIGTGLTDGEATTFYNLVQAMQTSLTRNV